MAKGGPLRITYHSVGKHTEFVQELIKAIPKQFRPSQKTPWIAMGLLLIVTCWGIVEGLLPVMDLSFDITQGEAFELAMDIGEPLYFFKIEGGSAEIKISAANLIIDLLLYTLLGYVIDILINSLLSLNLTQNPEDRKKKPKQFIFRQRSTSQKAGDQIVQKAAEKTTATQKTQNTQPTTQAKPAAQTKPATNNTTAPEATKI